MVTKSYRTFLLFSTVIILILSGVIVSVTLAQESDGNGSSNGSKRIELEQQIQQLEQEAAEFDKHLKDVEQEKQTLDNEKEKLDTETKRRSLEIRRLSLLINQAGLDTKQRIADISDRSQKIEVSRQALGAGLFLLYAYEEESALTVLLKNRTLSDFFNTVHNLGRAREHIHSTLLALKDDKAALEKERIELEEFEAEQRSIKSLQEVERRLLEQKKKEKEELLRLTKGKEALFQQLIQSKKRDITTLRTQLFYLEKTGITAEDAVRMAELAAKRAGIRPAFLLALLEVETGKQFEDGVISVGTNLGTGNWERDLYQCYRNLGRRQVAEAEKRAFFEITGKLNLDPDSMPVSRRPSYGCGGAMGPAQFLPTTWLRFESKVAALTGHNPPSPWNVEDAFTASAIFLAEAGATSQTPTGETRAAKTYLSGRPNCSSYICRFYSSRILALAKDIDRIL